MGRLLIGCGVTLLLFVAYQLWGTGIQHARAQQALDGELEALLHDAEAAGLHAADTGSRAAGPTDGPRWTDTAVSLALRADGDAVARLEIPAIGVDEVVVEGVAAADLRRGPGHYGSTPLPGQEGNAAIAGHRTTYGAPFAHLDHLDVGDRIVVTTVQGTFTYRVMPSGDAYPDLVDDGGDGVAPHTVVDPADSWVLGDFGDDRLTLTACHPEFSARERIVVAAALVDDPGAPLPTVGPGGHGVQVVDQGTGARVDLGAPALPDGAAGIVTLDDGLSWDLAPLPAAVFFAALTLMILLGTQLVAGRWRRLPTYAVGALPLLVGLYLTFEQVDRILPAY